MRHLRPQPNDIYFAMEITIDLYAFLEPTEKRKPKDRKRERRQISREIEHTWVLGIYRKRVSGAA